MTEILEDTEIELYVPGAGQFRTTRDTMRQAIENYLPATEKQLRQFVYFEIVCDWGSHEYYAEATVPELLFVICECGYAAQNANQSWTKWEADWDRQQAEHDEMERRIAEEDRADRIRAIAMDLAHREQMEADGIKVPDHWPTDASFRAEYGDEMVGASYRLRLEPNFDLVNATTEHLVEVLAVIKTEMAK